MSKRRKPRTPEQKQAAARKLAEKRARALIGQARQREIERAAQTERDRLAEICNEALVPAIMRHPIVGADGNMALGPRVQIVAGRPIRAADIGMPCSDRHSRAVARLRAEHAAVGEGCNAPAVDMARAGGGGDGSGGHAAMLAQIAVLDSLRGAMARLSGHAAIARRVLLEYVPVSVWAAETGNTVPDAMACLREAVSLLADHYWPPSEGAGRRGMLTVAPPRSDYSVALDGATETCQAVA